MWRWAPPGLRRTWPKFVHPLEVAASAAEVSPFAVQQLYMPCFIVEYPLESWSDSHPHLHELQYFKELSDYFTSIRVCIYIYNFMWVYMYVYIYIYIYTSPNPISVIPVTSPRILCVSHSASMVPWMCPDYPFLYLFIFDFSVWLHVHCQS